MKSPKLVITIVSIYFLIFQAAILMDASVELVFAMLSLAPFALLYMVYVILKYGKPSPHTFSERFYDDWDYVRNGLEELDEKP